MPCKSLIVAVIGAGQSGLTAARELLREGHHVTIFEKNHRVGGTWLYDPRTESDPLGIDPTRKTVHSSAYLSMRTNTPRQLMGFLDYPFEKHQNGDPRTFPGHDEVLCFLERFAEEFGIREMIRFETEVVRVENKKNKDEWVVEWKRNWGCESSIREVFEAVVVCSGHFAEPKLPDPEIPGIQNWRRYQMHSHNYRVPDPFLGQVVVIIGYGPSGLDISKDVAAIAKEVHIATRVNPNKLQDFDNIRHHNTIKCVYEDGLVVFEDGFSVHADAIIHCTGYKYHIPFLETKGIVSVEENGVGPLYKHVFPPSLAPSLSFIGFTSQRSLTIIELQSKWLARVLSGKVELPSDDEMMESVRKYYQQMQQIYGFSKGYSNILPPFEAKEYEKWLVEESGVGGLEEWRGIMLEECFKKLLVDYDHNYRDQWDDAYWEAIIHNHSSSSKN